MNKLTNAGGKRTGAGRKKSPVITKPLGLRVPVQYHAQLTELVKAEVKRLQALGNN